MLPCSNSNFPAMKLAVALSSAFPLDSMADRTSESTLPSFTISTKTLLSLARVSAGVNVGRSDLGGAGTCVRGHAPGVDVIDKRLRDGVGVVSYFIFVVVAVFADAIDNDGAPILEMDSVSQGARARERERHQRQKDDT